MRSVIGDGEAHYLRVKVLHYISVSDVQSNMSDAWFGLCRHGTLPVEIRTDHSSTATHVGIQQR